MNLPANWEWPRDHRPNRDYRSQIPEDRRRQNSAGLFYYSVACALVTSGDSLCVTFPFGDSPISRNSTAKVAARACLLETTEPAVIHTSSHRGFALRSEEHTSEL